MSALGRWGTLYQQRTERDAPRRGYRTSLSSKASTARFPVRLHVHAWPSCPSPYPVAYLLLQITRALRYPHRPHPRLLLLPRRLPRLRRLRPLLSLRPETTPTSLVRAAFGTKCQSSEAYTCSVPRGLAVSVGSPYTTASAQVLVSACVAYVRCARFAPHCLEHISPGSCRPHALISTYYPYSCSLPAARLVVQERRQP